MKIHKIIPPCYLFLIFAVILLSTLQYLLTAPVRPRTDRLVYLHYHIISVRVDGSPDLFNGGEAVFEIYNNDGRVTGIGGQQNVQLKYNSRDELWEGRFPVPWAAPPGPYRIEYSGGGEIRAWEGVFSVHSRSPMEISGEPLKVMTLETTRPLRGFNIPPPGVEEGAGYRGIFCWTRYIGGNTLWYLAAQTASYSEGDLSVDYPWLEDNLRTLERFSSEEKESGLDFGAWIVAFRAFGIFSLRPNWYNYSYAYNRATGALYETNGISILDNRRIRDIIEMASYLNSLEDVSYIGLDYIRPAPAVAGLELVDDFTESMDIELPQYWADLNRKERMKWLGDIVSAPGSYRNTVKQKWNWYRARRMALIIKRIKEEAELDKPLWVFMLSWDKGHEHGQDAVMFQDAGADIVSVMMYEADRRRFKGFVRSWKDYLKDSRVNLVLGNQIDWTVHQYTLFPSGPQEFGNRLEMGITQLASPLNLKGVFVNDFSRTIRGRTGPYEKSEWLAASGRAFSLLNRPLRIDLGVEVKEDVFCGDEFRGKLRVENISDYDIHNIQVEVFETPYVKVFPDSNKIPRIEPGSAQEVYFTGEVSSSPSIRKGNYMVAFRVKLEDDIYIDYEYFPVRNIPVDIGTGLR